MKEIYIDELKKIQLEILASVHDFCVSKKIEYSLAFGTLIGAVRHKGYIPWDDDIDICMTRPNYNRFVNEFNGNYECLKVISPELDWGYYAPYANVIDTRTILRENNISHRKRDIGVKIDIFPIDAVPDNLEQYVKVNQKLRLYNIMMSMKRYKFTKNWFSKYFVKQIIYKLLYIPFSYEFLQKRMHKYAVESDYRSSQFVGNLKFVPFQLRCHKSVFNDFIDVDFEDFKFKAIRQYDVFLGLIYGDYMKMPPKNKRIPHHGFTAYWK